MSEEKTTYGTSVPRTLDAFRNRPCSRVWWDAEYKPPTPDEITALVKLAGWSQREQAMIAGVTFNEKGSTTIRKWRKPRGHQDHREIPWAVWRRFLEYAGVVTIEDTLQAIAASNYVDKCAE